MFYTYSQNNSGGRWDGPEYIIIEAEDAEFANFLAQRKGIYFNGCYSGRDCSCCGDRWNEVSNRDGKDSAQIYGVKAEEHKPYAIYNEGENACHIHYLDGTTKIIEFTEKAKF